MTNITINEETIEEYGGFTGYDALIKGERIHVTKLSTEQIKFFLRHLAKDLAAHSKMACDDMAAAEAGTLVEDDHYFVEDAAHRLQAIAWFWEIFWCEIQCRPYRKAPTDEELAEKTASLRNQIKTKLELAQSQLKTDDNELTLTLFSLDQLGDYLKECRRQQVEIFERESCRYG